MPVNMDFGLNTTMHAVTESTVNIIRSIENAECHKCLFRSAKTL